jgi:Holliday junction DNA helicase RuvB
MCDASGSCKGGHGHPEKETAEDKPPGLRLEARKGQVYQFTRGLPTDRLVEAICHCARLEDLGRFGCGFYLNDMEERGVHLPKGFATTIEFAMKRLGRGKTAVNDMKRVAREIVLLPRIFRAFQRAELHWSQVLLLIQVATPENEKEWLELARKLTVRKLARKVRKKVKGSRPSEKDNDLGSPRLDGRIVYEVPIAFAMVWDRHMEKRLVELGPDATPMDVLIEVMEKGILCGAPPEVVFHVSPDGKCWIDSDDGKIPVDREEALLLARGGRATRLRDPDPGEYSAIPFGERGSVPLAERDDPTPRAIREAVLKRDGHRCVLCGSRKDCRVHHCDSRANGGEARIERMVTLCLVHHSMAHEGLITICVDLNGKPYARDPQGRDLSVDVPLSEVLEDAPDPHGMISFEVAGVPAGRPAVGHDDVLDGEEEVEHDGGVDDDEAAGRPAAAEDVVDGVAGDRAAGRPVTEVLTGQGSPSRREFLRAIRLAQSIERIPSRLTRDEWHALSGRLEWLRGKGELVFDPDREAAPPREPAAPIEREGARKLSDLIGQDRVRERLGELVTASHAFGEPLPHMLFEGPAGLGKSSFARAMAEEMGAGIQIILGSALKDPKEVASLLTGLRRGDILFIDEIHDVEKKTLESFYTALQERSFQRTVHQGSRSRSFEIALEPFTLMGATTEGGALPEPLRSRFSQVVRLVPYSEAELVEIAKLCAARLSVSMTPEASLELARRSRGTPRLLENFIQSARAHAVARKRPGIDVASVLETRVVQEIDDAGLDRQDREILRYLLEVGRPIGLKAVAAALRMDARTIERVHEPYLIEKGFVVRTSRGRVATEKARAHLAQAKAA